MHIIYMSNRRTIFFLITILAIMAFYFKPDFDLDIYRYYENTPGLARIPIYEYISDCVNNYSDFMYRATLILIYNMDFSLGVANALYVGSYYFLIYKIISEYLIVRKIKLSKKDELIVIIASFFSALPIFVFSVSRMLSGIVVFYLGFYFIIRHKYIYGFLTIVASLTFHLGMSLFLLMLLFSWCVNKIDASKYLGNQKIKLLFLLMVGFFPLFFFYLYFPIIQSFVFETGLFGNHPYQEIYLNGDVASSQSSVFYREMWYIRYGEPISLLILFFCLVKIRQHEVVNYGISFLFLYSSFLGSVSFLGDRMMMIMPVLYGILMSNVIYEQRIKQRNASFFIRLMLFYSVFNILNFYTCRTVFFGMH